jgi:hypothetical protein
MPICILTAQVSDATGDAQNFAAGKKLITYNPYIISCLRELIFTVINLL